MVCIIFLVNSTLPVYTKVVHRHILCPAIPLLDIYATGPTYAQPKAYPKMFVEELS